MCPPLLHLNMLMLRYNNYNPYIVLNKGGYRENKSKKQNKQWKSSGSIFDCEQGCFSEDTVII